MPASGWPSSNEMNIFKKFLMFVDLTKPRYDQTTFTGRLQHFTALIDPRTLLATTQELQAATQELQSHTANKDITKDKAAKLWRAKYLIDSTYHPDTHQPILLPFRMSAFVPANLLITAGLLIPNPSIKSIVFWQWVNQSFNVGFNWANANKTAPMSVKETAMAYVMAVGASVSVAVGLNRIIRNPLLVRFVPFAAVGSAGALNVFLMRRKELVDGIAVMNDQGEVVGTSQRAGWMAVSQVAISRLATSFPCLTLPPLLMAPLDRTKLLQSYPGLGFAANLILITATMMTALPAAVALFPQYGSVSVDQLEPRFHDLRDKRGARVTHVIYNKGI
jgi:sideroflexin-5